MRYAVVIGEVVGSEDVSVVMLLVNVGNVTVVGECIVDTVSLVDVDSDSFVDFTDT